LIEESQKPSWMVKKYMDRMSAVMLKPRAIVNEWVNLKIAKHLLNLAEGESEKIGIPMVIAICDRDGQIIVQERMDNSLLVSVDLAPRKARAAVRFKKNTDAIAEEMKPGKSLEHLAQDAELNPMYAGGVLLLNGPTILGAIGVSGGPEEADKTVAEAVAEAFIGLICRK